MSQGLGDALWLVCPPIPCPCWQSYCGSCHPVPVLAFHNDVKLYRLLPSCMQMLLFGPPPPPPKPTNNPQTKSPTNKRHHPTPPKSKQTKKHHFFTSPLPLMIRHSKCIFSRSEPSWGELAASSSGKTELIGWSVPNRHSHAAETWYPHGYSAYRGGRWLKVGSCGRLVRLFVVWQGEFPKETQVWT